MLSKRIPDVKNRKCHMLKPSMFSPALPHAHAVPAPALPAPAPSPRLCSHPHPARSHHILTLPRPCPTAISVPSRPAPTIYHITAVSIPVPSPLALRGHDWMDGGRANRPRHLTVESTAVPVRWYGAHPYWLCACSGRRG